MLIENKVKNTKVLSVEDFLSLEFNNLKDITRDVSKLEKSILKNGFTFPVYVWENNNYCIDGKGRELAIRSLIEQGHEFEGIPYVEIQAKDLKEAKERVLSASSQYGDITNDSLKEFMGEDKFDASIINFSDVDVDALLDGDFDINEVMPDDTSSYTEKIEIPSYEPKREKPKLDELVDSSKTDELIEKIENSNIEPEIKDFLKKSAQRHLKFNYENIAEYYAHADKEVQELFEDSVLVIIDFNKAVEKGFVDFIDIVIDENEDGEQQ